MGHATRCIPVINALLAENYTVIIASDGEALALLKKAFPKLSFEVLPAYAISYKPTFFGLKWQLIRKSFYNYNIYKKEQEFIKKLVKEKNLIGVISDNRFGVFSKEIPSVYITHQLRVFSGLTTFITSKIHQNIIHNYSECWVPDFEGKNNLSGALSHQITLKTAVKYIKPLSQFTTPCVLKKHEYDYLILLSGIEPKRSLLEQKLLTIFKEFKGTNALVQGKVSSEKTVTKQGNISVFNYLLQEELQHIICKSNVVICRSGYSSIMDMAALNKKVFFIPTQGQTEQEYLAKHLKKTQIAPFANEIHFQLKDLEQLANYNGFNIKKNIQNWQELFRVFH